MTIGEKMIELSGMYVSKFQNGEIGLDYFCKSEFALECMNMVYRKAVTTNQLQPIEEISSELKNKLWDDAKELCPDADKEKTINICKAIWIVNSISEK